MPIIRCFCVPLNKINKKEPESSQEDHGESDLDSDSDDDFENHDSSELTALAGGSCQSYTGSNPKARVIKIKLLNQRNQRGNGDVKRLKGRFDDMFLCPAWQIKVPVQETKPTQIAFLHSRGSPSYTIRTDQGVDKSVVCLFLESCKVHEQHVQRFVQFVESRGLEFSLVHLLATIAVYKEGTPTDKEIAEQIETSLEHSVPGKALQAPVFTKHVHQLFPKRASKLLDTQDCWKLQVLDQSIQQEPWVFGYKTILYNRYSLLGCEAKLKDLLESKVLDNVNPAMVDALFIYHAICNVTNSKGHTYVLLNRLKWAGHYRCPYAPSNHEITHWDDAMSFLVSKGILGTDDVEGVGPVVYLTKLKDYEETIASCIAELMEKDPWILSSSLHKEDFSGDTDQLEAAQLIANMPVVVMSGKGGCGKTYVVSKVLCEVNKHIRDTNNDDNEGPPQDGMSLHENKAGEGKKKGEQCIGPVLLTAPTGRAASILGKRTGIPSYTMHHVIYSDYMYKSNESNDKWKFAGVRMLVCDECSLVSVRTFSNLIRILTKKAKLQQLVLLGDIHQLPSIEPGNFLSDVFNSLNQYGLSITLRRNHRAESEQIVENAQRIAERKNPHFSEAFVAVTFEAGSSQDLNVSQTVRGLLERDLFTHEKSQFIALRRKDCQIVNEMCCRHYNKHPMKNPKGKTDFRVGDKICIGKNKPCFDVHSEAEVRLCNGEIFFIREDVTLMEGNEKTRYLDLDDGERMLKVDFKELRRAKMKHAWARTIHTYQGSETDTIVYVVGGSTYETWQHVYTAVTRGKSRVFIVHDPRHLSSAVIKEPITRQTRLGEFLDLAAKDAGDRLKALSAVRSRAASTTNGSGNELDDSDDDELLYQASQAVEQSRSGCDVTARCCTSEIDGIATGNDVNCSIDTLSDDDELLFNASQAVEQANGCDVTPRCNVTVRCSDDCTSQIDGIATGNDSRTGSDVNCSNDHLNSSDDDCKYFADDDDTAEMEMMDALDDAVDQYSLSQVAPSSSLAVHTRTMAVAISSQAAATSSLAAATSSSTLLSNGMNMILKDEEFFISRRNLHRRASSSCVESKRQTADQSHTRRNTWELRVNNNQLMSPSPPAKLVSRTNPSPPWTPQRGSRQTSNHASGGYFASSPSTPGKRDSSQAGASYQTPTKRACSPVMTAGFSTRCSACASPIRGGVDRISIRMRNTEKREWVHLDCVDR